ncbi:MAG TPA: hypothetical protein VFX25_32780 [Streptosporangiaceae bacterium]|nr:hypothetical protein [Streptosporangiaceae bacterium]
MSEIEDRLRAELWAQSQRTRAEDLRELRVPSPAPARRPAGARRRWWLAPAAAALAVAGVVAGVRLTAAPAPAAAPGARPAFYVTVPDTGSSGHPDATVRATATGAVLGRVSVPGTHFSDVTAAADDRTFVLAASRPPRGGASGAGTTEFYRLTLSAQGRPQPLARLGLTVTSGAAGYESGSMALSADGATLAVAVMPTSVSRPPGSKPPPGFQFAPGDPSVAAARARIEVVSLSTGRTRTWTAPSQAALDSLSWVRGGTLAYLTSGPVAGGGYQLRFLDTARAGSLAGASRAVALRGLTGELMSALATGHGQVVVAWTRAPGRAGHVGDAVLAAYSARTGRRLRVLDTLPSRGAFESYVRVWSADPSGDHVLAGGTTAAGQVTAGGIVRHLVQRAVLHRIDHGRVTALPDPGNLALAAAW